jgi:HK97 family phage prohead protease
MERKSVNFELKDIDRSKRTAVIAHCVYNNIDRTEDISRKGMFTKSWQESKDDINFYFNHNDEQAPGKVVDVFEDNEAAYTKAWLGTHTLGNDVLTMMDEGVIKKASFGYITQKKNYIDVKGRKVRELKEVSHLETSVLTKIPANPLAGVRQVVKSFYALPEIKALSPNEQAILKSIATSDMDVLKMLIDLSATLEPTSDLYTWINWNISRRADYIGDIRSQIKYNSGELKELQTHVETMEKFCRNTHASDDCIKSILLEIENGKQLISEYNTVLTQADEKSLEPTTSVEEKELLDVLTTFNKQLKTQGRNGNTRTSKAA